MMTIQLFFFFFLNIYQNWRIHFFLQAMVLTKTISPCSCEQGEKVVIPVKLT